MSNRYSRHQSVVNREADSHIDGDHWLKQFEKNLEKSAVQSRRVDQSLFDQINEIMNNKSKYTSVSAAVEDMMQRSGLTGYLTNINKLSQENINAKTADHKHEHKHEHDKPSMSVKLTGSKQMLPALLEKVPSILKTIENYIRDTKGHLPVPAILEKIKSIHKNDVSDAKDWETDDMLAFISKKNLEQKAGNAHDHDYANLGVRDTTLDANDSNNDAFSALMPAKI